MRTAWGAAGIAFAVFGAAPSRLDAKDKPSKEGVIAIEPVPKVQAGLLDCRSPVVAHEIAVALGTPWEFAGNAITFSLVGKALQVALQEAGTDKAKPVTPSHVPFLLSMKAFDLPYALSVRLDGERKHAMVSSAFGVAVTLSGETAYLVDSDRDGKLGTEGDGVVAPGCRTVAAWSKSVWSRNAAAEVRWNEASKAWEASPAPMPYPDRGEHAAGWRLLEWRRQQCGLLPLDYDKALEVGMVAHAEYSARYMDAGHEEDPKRPEFTVEGDAAGRECVIGYDKRTCSEGIEEFFATVFHRNACLTPNIARTAMVLHKGIFQIRTVAPHEGPLQEAVCVFPPHGMADVRPRFNENSEDPRPVPAGSPKLLGACVALAAPPWRHEGVAAGASLEVECGNEKHGWIPVAGTVYFSASPSVVAAYDGRGSVVLVPESALPSQALFRARARVSMPNAAGPDDAFRYEWEFATGK